MGEEEKNEPCTFPTIKFHLLPLPTAAMHSPDHHPSPPRETLASVPFKWEEEPGKARPCTDIIPLPAPGPTKLLEPPPCRLHLLPESRITKTPSPTTVLDGPGHGVRPRFSSFRLFRESFDDSSGGDSPHSSVDMLLGDGIGRKRIGFLGRGLRFKSNGKSKEGDGGSFGFSSASSAAGFEMEGKVKRNGSFSSLSQPVSPRLCAAAMYERLKHAVAWKTAKRKSKKDGFLLKV